MGRQIQFLQSEEDIKTLFEILHDLDVKTIIQTKEWKRMDLNTATQSVVDSMQSWDGQFEIIPPQVKVEDLEQMLSQFPHRIHLIDNGTAVEYWGCKKWELEPNAYMMGRLYVSTYYEGKEQEIAQKFFERLKRAIKKKYIYNKRNDVYVAPDFMMRYNHNEFKVVQRNAIHTPIIL